MSDGQFNMVLQQKSKSVAGRDDQASRNSYQSEDQLEKHLIEILCSQGYEYLTEVKSEEAMQANLRLQMEKLNRAKLMERPDGQGKGKFSDQEWQRFFDTIIANKSEGLLEKTRKLRQAHSFALDCGGGANPAGTSIPTCISKADAAGSSIPTVGVERNFRLLSQDPSENNFQVINQIERNSGGHKNRYDVTILVNGLPLVHIELKRRGVALQEAFHQVNRYRRESFWSESGLFNYVQIFIISNGTLTKYYSNTVRELSRMGQQGHLVTQNKTFAYEFASPWTDKKNNPIYDLCDFSRDFLEYRRLTVMLTRYCVLGTDDAMRILRPYQAHAVEAIERRVDISAARPGTPEAGGYIWHTTGSGKTLTSFVAATLLTEREDIDKVLFIVDRKDLDYQTMIEFNRFSKGSVDGTNNTKQLTGQLESSDQKIIVTTIQKLDRYIRQHRSSPFKQKRVVLIFDECHRSQFGIFHRNITGFFSRYHLFGFSGTPIFSENANRSPGAIVKKQGQNQYGTTEAIFGDRLCHYTIINAIRDKNVLPFKVDFIPTMRSKDNIDDKQVLAIDSQEALIARKRISRVVSHILKYHDTKTRQRRFNSILATASVGAAQIYWREFKNQQAALTDPESPDYNPLFRPLRIATIYSYSPNDADGSAEGDINSIDDETLESTEGLSTAAKDQLQESIDDYNKCFKTSFDSGKNFQDYYKDVSKRMKSHKEGGGDFPFQIDLLIVVNMFLTGFDAPTLNTLYVDKSLRLHGLLQAFSRTNRILNSEKSHGEILCFRPLEAQVDQSISLFGDEEALGIVLLRPYEEYLQEIKQHIGELQEMGSIAGLLRQSDKKQFIQIWGEILKHHNILKTFDEYPNTDQNRFLESVVQDNNSYYLELKDEYLEHKAGESILEDLVFETELVKSIEVNIDYILDLIEKYRNSSSQDQNLYSKLISSISASPTLRLKRELIEKFVAQLREEDSVDGQFSSFVEAEARKEAQEIAEEGGLDPVRLKRFINRSFKNGQLSTDGTSIVKLAKGQIGFGMKRKQWKMETVKVLTDYFEKYVDLVDAI